MGRLFNHTHRRSHWFRCIGLCALAALAATRSAIAVDPRKPAADYLRQTFTTEDGLPLDVVNDVLQTRDGFLIVGTANGVARFDGHRFAEMNSDTQKKSSLFRWRKGLTATSGLQPSSAFTGLHTRKSIGEGRLYRCFTWGRAQPIPSGVCVLRVRESCGPVRPTAFSILQKTTFSKRSPAGRATRLHV